MKELSRHDSFLGFLSHNQFIAALLLIVTGWFLIQIKEILMLLFTSYIVMAALVPFVELLRKYKVPRVIAVIIAYLLTISIFLLLVFPLVPFLVSQVQALLIGFPGYFEQAVRFLHIDARSAQLDSFLSTQLGEVGKNAFALTSVIFGGFFSLILVLVLSFYILLDHEKIQRGVTGLFRPELQSEILLTIKQIDEKLGAWVRGQAILSVTIGFFTWIALSILGIEFALPLAILAGILEIVPTIGPILSAVPAIIVSLAVSPSTTVSVIIAYTFIQTFENNILVPKIMQSAVGLNPIIVIIGITVGTKLMGVLGGLLSIPFITLCIIILSQIRKHS